MVNQRLKDFWINKINVAITTYSVDPNTLTEGADWAKTLTSLSKWKELDLYGKAVFKDVFTKARQAIPNPLLPNSDNYGSLLGDAFTDLNNEFLDLVEVMKTKIGVDPTDNTLATDDDGNNIIVDGNPVPKWKYTIDQKIYNQYSKLTDIPDDFDLADLLYRSKLYGEITTNLNNIIKGNLQQQDKASYLHLNWDYKVDDTVLQGYKIAATNLINRENQIKNALNRANIPNNWDNDFKPLFVFLVNTLNVDPDAPLPTIPVGEDLASLLARPTQTQLDNANDWITDLEKGFKEILEIAPADALPDNFTDLANLYKNQSGTQTIKQLKTKADNYDRIHTKLNGKVSDTELQALLDTIPTCSHTDYDTIKSERDTLKTENTQLKEHQCDCASKVAEKETQIITKIITDLGLTTHTHTERERERENLLEAVITEIKTKITPPADSADKQKISELEAKITSLQAPQSLNDVKVSSEVKKEITKLSQDLGISNQTFTEELKSVNSYQQLANLQNKVFKEELNKETDSKNSAMTLNYCLGALSIGSLLILAWILLKRTTFTPEIGNKKEKE